MGMRDSDVRFLRREVIPILQRAAHLSPDASAALDSLQERLARPADDEKPPPSSTEIVRDHLTSPCDADREAGVNVWAITLDVDDYHVPYIVGSLHEGGPHDGHVTLILDRRYGFDTDVEELRRWGWFLANAMAISAGRTSHGEHSYIRNPHGRSGGGDPPEILGTPVAADSPGTDTIRPA